MLFPRLTAILKNLSGTTTTHSAGLCCGLQGIALLSLSLYPLVGQAYFPRTDPGQFVINLKAPTGTRLEMSDQLVNQVEGIVREIVPTNELKIIVSNIGVTAGFSSIYTPNSGPHT